MNSSTAATLPLTHASSKNTRTRALLLSSADTGLPSPSQIANSRSPQRIDTLHDAICWAPTHLPKVYSLIVRKDRNCDVRLTHVFGVSCAGVLRSAHSLGPTIESV